MGDEKSIEALVSALRTSQPSTPASPLVTDSFDHLSNESILRLYEGIRHQVEADKALGDRYRLVGDAAKTRAGLIREELLRRGLKFAPIVWP